MHICKKLTITTTFSLLLLFFVAAVTFAAAQTNCPVMGGTINKELYADYKGERIYFCCEACKPQFVKDPEKYIKKMKEMGLEPEKIGSAQEPEKVDTNK